MPGCRPDRIVHEEAPRAARAFASLFAAAAASDFLHESYENLRANRKRLAAEAQG